MTETLILTNGRFYTMNPAQPTATAVAIREGRFLAVGDDEAMTAIGGKVVDLNGRCATPGLVDAHVHFQHFAIARQRVNLDGCQSLSEALNRIAQSVKTDNPSRITHHGSRITENWLQGRGWAQGAWDEGRFPTAADLDQLVPEQPAYFAHKSGHAAWVNSRALQLAGVDETTPDPPGGQIQRDMAGKPTGVLFEEAMDLVANIIPQPTEAQLVAWMKAAQDYCWQAGLVGLHDFDGRFCFQSLQTLRQNGELGLRVVKNVPVYRLEHAIGVGLRTGFGDDWLRIGGVKIFADGALGPKTAAMIQPYEGEPDHRGIVVTDKEEMAAFASQASAHGLSVTIHAIGDRANHDVLDVYEAVRQEEKERLETEDWRLTDANLQSPTTNLRHRIEHVQVLHPGDLNRLAELNVIASMQPTHATSDMEMADRYWGERARYSYAWRTMLESGATLVFGSDAPIEEIDPLPGLYAAVSRRRADGPPGPDGWYPEQRLNIAEAVHAFTRAAAITGSQEAHQGAIAPGMLADLTIFDRDIFQIPADELLDVAIAGTMIGGEFKHRTW